METRIAKKYNTIMIDLIEDDYKCYISEVSKNTCDKIYC